MEKKTKEISYNKAIEEVEKILRSLDEENRDMETLVKDVRKAVELLDSCKVRLKAAEEEIDKLFEKE